MEENFEIFANKSENSYIFDPKEQMDVVYADINKLNQYF